MDIDRDSFEREVLQASAAKPVLVDFWAPWCAPCRTLGPVLEKLEREYAGRFKLAKVNSDEHQDLAAEFAVRSIPAVFCFRNGRVVDRFLGALPESQVRAFIDRNLPSPVEGQLAIAARLVEAGDLEAAEKILDAVPEHIDWDEQVAMLRAAIGYARAARGDDAELRERLARDPKDHDARLTLAQVHAGKGRWREALEALLEIVRADKQWREGLARTEMLKIFSLAAADPDLVSEYRRKLATALY